MSMQYALVAVALALTSCGPPVWLGTFGSSGGVLGAWSTTAWSCSSGVSESAEGRRTTVTFRRRGEGDLTTGTGPHVPMGVWVTHYPPFRQADLDPERCTRFDVRHVHQPDGSIGADVEVDCDTGSGGRVVASLHAQSCP